VVRVEPAVIGMAAVFGFAQDQHRDLEAGVEGGGLEFRGPSTRRGALPFDGIIQKF
jgi:hypothetical protein